MRAVLGVLLLWSINFAYAQTGACCVDGVCHVRELNDCPGGNSAFQLGVACADVTCGSCCTPNGCASMLSTNCPVDQFKVNGNCTDNCRPCCMADHTCALLEAASCRDSQGFLGSAGQTCDVSGKCGVCCSPESGHCNLGFQNTCDSPIHSRFDPPPVPSSPSQPAVTSVSTPTTPTGGSCCLVDCNCPDVLGPCITQHLCMPAANQSDCKALGQERFCKGACFSANRDCTACVNPCFDRVTSTCNQQQTCTLDGCVAKNATPNTPCYLIPNPRGDIRVCKQGKCDSRGECTGIEDLRFETCKPLTSDNVGIFSPADAQCGIHECDHGVCKMKFALPGANCVTNTPCEKGKCGRDDKLGKCVPQVLNGEACSPIRGVDCPIGKCDNTVCKTDHPNVDPCGSNDGSQCIFKTCKADFSCHFECRDCHDDDCNERKCTPEGCKTFPRVGAACDPAGPPDKCFPCGKCVVEYDVLTNPNPSNEAVCKPIPLDCNTTNPCLTNATCVADKGCTYDQVPCHDNNKCTLDFCNFTTGCFHKNVTCPEDDNQCTVASCDPYTGCGQTPLNNTQCKDPHNICLGRGICYNGNCTFPHPLHCDDYNECTTDTCDPYKGCIFTPIVCNDYDKCTVDTCDPATGCVFPPVICAQDDNVCTKEKCDPHTGQCVSSPITIPPYQMIPCDDGNTCTVGDFCLANGTCHAGDLCKCDDGDPCTIDSCRNPEGCVHEPQTSGSCDDGDLCTVDDRCKKGKCKGDPKNCDDFKCSTRDSCDPTTGKCISTYDSSGCKDTPSHGFMPPPLPPWSNHNKKIWG